MSRPKPKRRKAYRPKPVGAPLASSTVDSIVVGCYAALSSLQFSGEHDARRAARNELAATVSMAAHLESLRTGHVPDEVAAANGALHSVVARFREQGSYGVTGGELEALRACVRWFDANLGRFRTDQLEAALASSIEAAGCDELPDDAERAEVLAR